MSVYYLKLVCRAWNRWLGVRHISNHAKEGRDEMGGKTRKASMSLILTLRAWGRRSAFECRISGCQARWPKSKWLRQDDRTSKRCSTKETQSVLQIAVSSRGIPEHEGKRHTVRLAALAAATKESVATAVNFMEEKMLKRYGTAVQRNAALYIGIWTDSNVSRCFFLLLRAIFFLGNMSWSKASRFAIYAEQLVCCVSDLKEDSKDG